MPYKNGDKLKESKAKYEEKRKGMRTRAWACIVYPESAPEDWIDRLKTAHIETLISPLHDSDVLANGEPKKAHFHVLALFPNPVQEGAAKRYFSLIGVTAPPEMVNNAKGYARYLVHMDDHDKYRYSEEDVRCLCGADWKSVALDAADAEDRILDEIENWVDTSGCVSYAALCRYARHERPDWKRTVRTHTIHLVGFMKSTFWDAQQELKKKDRPRG